MPGVEKAYPFDTTNPISLKLPKMCSMGMSVNYLIMAVPNSSKTGSGPHYDRHRTIRHNTTQYNPGSILQVSSQTTRE